jgi:hypothetical protein
MRSSNSQCWWGNGLPGLAPRGSTVGQNLDGEGLCIMALRKVRKYHTNPGVYYVAQYLSKNLHQGRCGCLIGNADR